MRCGCCAPSGGARLPAVLRNSLTYSLTLSLIQSSTQPSLHASINTPKQGNPHHFTHPRSHATTNAFTRHRTHPPTHSPAHPASYTYLARYLMRCGCCAPSGGARLPAFLRNPLTYSPTLSLIRSSTQPSFHPPTSALICHSKSLIKRLRNPLTNISMIAYRQTPDVYLSI